MRAVQVHIDDPTLEHEIEVLRVRAKKFPRAERLASRCCQRKMMVEVSVDNALQMCERINEIITENAMPCKPLHV